MQNLLSAIGAAPHMVRPNLPHQAGHYPACVQLALLPFGERALRASMFLERPEGMDLSDAEGIAAVGRAIPHKNERDIVPTGQDFATVGHLYRPHRSRLRPPGGQVRRALAVRRATPGPGYRGAFPAGRSWSR